MFKFSKYRISDPSMQRIAVTIEFDFQARVLKVDGGGLPHLTVIQLCLDAARAALATEMENQAGIVGRGDNAAKEEV